MPAKKYATEAERKEAAYARRKRWYDENRKHDIQQQKDKDERKNKEDPNYIDNKTRSRDYYQKYIKPLRQMAKMMHEQGIMVQCT